MEIREGFDETNGLKAQTDEKPDSGSKPETVSKTSNFRVLRQCLGMSFIKFKKKTKETIPDALFIF